ncbi:response regulator [Glutamicibacter arilaitensis]|uniref:response regulator n=1 Tax=Glutamicibacter arilaitensis TaxID=256701 RepID=UPI00384BC5FB
MPDEYNRIIIGVVDDERFTRIGLQQELWRRSPDGYKLMVVYGPTVQSLFTVFDKHEPRLPKPHIVLLDLMLKDDSNVGDNVQAIRERDIPVLVISNMPSHETTRQAYSAGASGVVHKQRSTDDLIADIFEVIKGRIIYTKAFALAIKSSADYPDAKLSRRQKETLALYSLGYSMIETGKRLDPPLLHGTVKTNLARIRDKYLNVGRDVEGFANIRKRAYEDGLLTYELFLKSLEDDAYNVIDGEQN